MRRFLHPDVDRHLLVAEGEYVIDEVTKHWVTLVRPILLILAVVPMSLLMPLAGGVFWIPLAGAAALLVAGVIQAHLQYMDRFVITNMRVFRVHGILDQHLATMPMTRILDISVNQPFLGRIFGFGHFVFESAAQDQGLRDITYVARPEERDLTIQRVIQRAGLRATARPIEEFDENAEEGL